MILWVLAALVCARIFWVAFLVLTNRPHFVIGTNYMSRWWVIPRNRLFNIYLHRIIGDDDDRALHDHPWWNCSLLLAGAYVEHMPEASAVRQAGSVVIRRPEAPHRLAVHTGPVWTLFITGPIVRQWGFYCPRGWRHWKEFTAPNNKGQIGRGCE